MRNRYFVMYECIKFKECFYIAHAERAKFLYDFFSAITLCISIVSVLIWSISKSMPALWAIIIAAAQFAQALSVKLPWAEQIVSARYLLPELKKLSLRIDHDWLSINTGDYEESKILELISNYESVYASLETQFTQFAEFREVKSVLRKAEEKQRAYFYSKYPSTKNEEGNEVAYAGT